MKRMERTVKKIERIVFDLVLLPELVFDLFPVEFCVFIKLLKIGLEIEITISYSAPMMTYVAISSDYRDC